MPVHLRLTYIRNIATAFSPMTPNLQPRHLRNEYVELLPLEPGHLEPLYAVAADPLIWEQHPNPNRWRRADFLNYFEGALASGGAFLILDAATMQPIGSTRFYDFDAAAGELKIGYTFFARSHWGGVYNPATKRLMLNYACTFAQKVIFHVGACNTRSRMAMERLGAVKAGEEPVQYYGEAPQLNVVYEITKEQWKSRAR